ncbi:hypothetical protein BB561_004659 [Smittium simulii]|uniref:Reverse transcriptase domain-containing protein n=1 Tax=Smittium simulii TaxID=133385 RepID=A0A2T9YF10_9FUNG|nr:hypothetical protein BB561_004659 [Smittium simulii]
MMKEKINTFYGISGNYPKNNDLVGTIAEASKNDANLDKIIDPLADVPDTNNLNVCAGLEAANKQFIEQKKDCTVKLLKTGESNNYKASNNYPANYIDMDLVEKLANNNKAKTAKIDNEKIKINADVIVNHNGFSILAQIDNAADKLSVRAKAAVNNIVSNLKLNKGLKTWICLIDYAKAYNKTLYKNLHMTVEVDGVHVPGLSKWIPGLLFADDAVVLAEPSDKLQISLDVMTKWSEIHKMTISAGKCGVMSVNYTLSGTFQLQNQTVLIVKKYTYLEIIFTDT